MPSDFQVRVMVSFATVLVLVKSMDLPVPRKFDQVMFNPYFVCMILFSSAWGATQDILASIIGVFIYVSCVILFYDKQQDQLMLKDNKIVYTKKADLIKRHIDKPFDTYVTSNIVAKKSDDDTIETQMIGTEEKKDDLNTVWGAL